MIQERLIGYIEQSIRQNWEIEALSNYKEKGYSYKEIAEKILKLHILFKGSGIKEGDKIALIGRNSANWCVTYLASVTFGAVVVPILPDFKPDDLTNIINHSDSRLLFVDDKIACADSALSRCAQWSDGALSILECNHESTTQHK